VSVTTPIAPLQTQKSQKCPNHFTSQLTPNGKCPVYVVYVYPTNYQKKPQKMIDGHCKRQCTSQSVAELCHSQTKSLVETKSHISVMMLTRQIYYAHFSLLVSTSHVHQSPLVLTIPSAFHFLMTCCAMNLRCSTSWPLSIQPLLTVKTVSRLGCLSQLPPVSLPL